MNSQKPKKFFNPHKLKSAYDYLATLFMHKQYLMLKANILFANFEIKEPADLILVYSMLYIVLCLKRLQKCINKERGVQEMFTLALERFAIPGVV